MNKTAASAAQIAKCILLHAYSHVQLYLPAMGVGSGGAAAPPGDILAPPGRLLPSLRLVSWAILGNKKRF